MKATTILAMVLALAVPAVARAQSGAEAEQLFRDGRKLMDQGKYDEACKAFKTSNELDPSVATLANLANCYEKAAHLASAWNTFLEVERQTRGDKKQTQLNKTAKDRAKAIEPKLSYLTISVPSESKIEGLALTRNGEPFDEGRWNRALPVDGGEYVVAGKAPGHEEWSTTVSVPDENGRASVDVPKFKEVEKLITPPDGEANPPPDGEHPEPVDVAAPSSFTGQRKIALGVGAVGLLAAGGGIVFGLQSQKLEQKADDLCPDPTCAEAVRANGYIDDAKQKALFSNIAFGVAGAAVVTAAILWFTGGPDAPSSSETAFAPALTPNSVGLDVAVRF